MSNPVDARVAGRLSMAYMMAFASEVLRRFPIDMLDMVLITTIANLNLTADGAVTRERLADPAPRRIGVSRNAVSRALNVPLETARRRIAVLIKRNILVEQDDGLVFSPDNGIALGNNAALNEFNMNLLRTLIRDLRGFGVELD